MTDDKWQHSFTGQKTKYADDVLYHSKAGYLKIGNEERFVPLSLELGLEMASIFGGTAYRPLHGGTMETLKGRTGLKAFWKALPQNEFEETDIEDIRLQCKKLNLELPILE